MSFDDYSCSRLFVFECACEKCAARCLSEFGDAKVSRFEDGKLAIVSGEMTEAEANAKANASSFKLVKTIRIL